VISYIYSDPQIVTAYIFIFLGMFIMILALKKRRRTRYVMVRRTMFLVPLVSGATLLGFGITILLPYSELIATIRSYTLGIGFLTIGILMVLMSMYVAMKASRRATY